MAFSQTCISLETGFLSFVEVFRGAEYNGKGLKALALTISDILYNIFSTHIFA